MESVQPVTKRGKWILHWIPVALWMVVIYGASNDTHSMEHTVDIVGPILRFFDPGISPEAFTRGLFIARKMAHVTVYAVLAGLVWSALVGTFASNAGKWNWRPFLWAMALTVAYAGSDEFHQTFVTTRQGTPWDVLIDGAGAVLGLILVWGLWRLKTRGLCPPKPTA